MADICNDNRFEIIAKAKADLLESTNIETDEAEMAVIDNILFRCWQMGWLDRYDRKDEPTISKMEQVDKDINVRSKDEPKWTKENCKGCKYNEYPYDSGTCFVRVCINGNKYEPKDDPQTGEMMTEEEFDSMLARVLTDKTEPQTERSE